MTFVRPAPVGGLRHVATITDVERRELDRLLERDPYANSMIAARVAAFRTIRSAAFGGPLLGARTEGRLGGAVFNGGNLVPIGGDANDWFTLAHAVAEEPRRCTSIVGRRAAVQVMWQVLEPSWGPARAVRGDQPLLVVGRSELAPVAPHPRLRVMGVADLERYLPAAAAMFTEELGISPFDGTSGASYRRRVEMLLANGRGLAVLDEDGRIAFKADLGAVTRHTCQVQGVWTRPDLRGRGVGTAALAGVLRHALRLAPTASLYVNDFNTAARRLYARLGMRQVGSLSTVLL